MARHNPSTYTDLEVVAGIRKGGTCMDRMTNYLYQRYHCYVYHHMKNKPYLEKDHLEFAYDDAIIALVRIIVQGKYDPNLSKLSTLLHRIFVNKYIDRFRMKGDKKRHFESILSEITPNLPDQSRDFLKSLMIHEQFDDVCSKLSQLGPQAKGLVMALDYWGFSPDEAAKMFGYKNGRTASQAKYKFKERLREMFQS